MDYLNALLSGHLSRAAVSATVCCLVLAVYWACRLVGWLWGLVG